MPETPDIAPSVRAEHLTAGYREGRPVITDLSFLVTGPGLVRIGGANGSGKSTLVEVMSGYLRPFHGFVEICGLAAELPATRAYRLVCRTSPALHPSLNVHDHLIIAARAHGRAVEEVMGRVEAFGLSGFLGEPISGLSSGTAKKLWYVLATTSCRPVMILDEPFNAIDVATVRCMVKEVNAWSKHNLVMLVSHLLPDGLEVRETLVLDRPKTAGCGDCAMM